MAEQKTLNRAGKVKGNSLETPGKEGFVESLDRTLTGDGAADGVNTSRPVIAESKIRSVQQLTKEVNEDLEEDLGGVDTI